MRIAVTNQLQGEITSIISGAIDVTVMLNLDSFSLKAFICMDDFADMYFEVGETVSLAINGADILIAQSFDGQTNWNCLAGTIVLPPSNEDSDSMMGIQVGCGTLIGVPVPFGLSQLLALDWGEEVKLFINPRDIILVKESSDE